MCHGHSYCPWGVRHGWDKHESCSMSRMQVWTLGPMKQACGFLWNPLNHPSKQAEVSCSSCALLANSVQTPKVGATAWGGGAWAPTSSCCAKLFISKPVIALCWQNSWYWSFLPNQYGCMQAPCWEWLKTSANSEANTASYTRRASLGLLWWLNHADPVVPAPSPSWPYLLAWTKRSSEVLITAEVCQHAERAQPPEACPALLLH